MIQMIIHGVTYEVTTTEPFDLSIPNRFDGKGPRLFGGSGSELLPYRSGDFVGSVDAGGSCNVATITITPHLDGTHTESVGHIKSSGRPVSDVVRDVLIPASVVTIRPEVVLAESSEWDAVVEANDRVITKSDIRFAIRSCLPGFLGALIVRTLPNDASRQNADYDETGAPYFSSGAMEEVVNAGVLHLVVDLPSVDRLRDGGHLQCHKIFFGVAPEVDRRQKECSITELAYIGEQVVDGPYLLNLQLPSFSSDAAPSRPLLLPVRAAAVSRT